MSDTRITVRIAGVGDAAAMARIQVLGWGHAFGHIMSKEFLAARGFGVREGEWRQRLENPKAGSLHLVAEEAGEVAGIASGGPVLDDEVIVEGDVSAYTAQAYLIYVATDRLSRGIGRMLLGQLAERLAAAGHRNLILWVFADNPYRRFYDSLAGRPVAKAVWDIGESVLSELGYGWEDIQSLIAACRTSPLTIKT
jgi:GNAT superfamily N-acetyltransferase